jgi:hypothetical protein
MSIQENIIGYWKKDLEKILKLYNRRPAPIYFIPILFFFFIIVNISCYWLAMYTAFPELIFGPPRHYYFKVQFPVGILGACFDTASFFITIWIVKRAIKIQKISQFYSHLSIDLVIAILATFWVLFVFTFSSWAIRYIEPTVFVYDISQRQEIYEQRVISAIAEPGKNIRNIYFGLLMGISAMLPTLTHIFYAIKSSSRVIIGSNLKNNLINSEH